jgi:hypothetical protein
MFYSCAPWNKKQQQHSELSKAPLNLVPAPNASRGNGANFASARISVNTLRPNNIALGTLFLQCLCTRDSTPQWLNFQSDAGKEQFYFLRCGFGSNRCAHAAPDLMRELDFMVALKDV